MLRAGLRYGHMDGIAFRYDKTVTETTDKLLVRERKTTPTPKSVTPSPSCEYGTSFFVSNEETIDRRGHHLVMSAGYTVHVSVL